MARNTDPASPPTNESQPYPAEKARGGEIILRTSGRRIIFIAGLAGAVLLAILMQRRSLLAKIIIRCERRLSYRKSKAA